MLRRRHKKMNLAYKRSNYNEHYSRKTNFKVFGVAERTEENTEELMMKVIEKTAGVQVQRSDVIACHRIPGEPGKHRPILVKMRNSECKAKVMKNRSKVKKEGNGVRLVDDVTRANAELITRLMRHEDVESAWYFNCAVYGSFQGKRVKFDITDDDPDTIARKMRSKRR
ncbi:hypothetical protein FSP39_013416 [Pinctada imbricata]|uniref:Uncharacterized protein n=1 Tax=Pinctada imbricata TaxID=66713 RepID=A0AA89BPK5_PINIB|nr:hypothetical protein FSP39_013416 [Pinctada imbricata]